MKALRVILLAGDLGRLTDLDLPTDLVDLEEAVDATALSVLRRQLGAVSLADTLLNGVGGGERPALLTVSLPHVLT